MAIDLSWAGQSHLASPVLRFRPVDGRLSWLSGAWDSGQIELSATSWRHSPTSPRAPEPTAQPTMTLEGGSQCILPTHNFSDVLASFSVHVSQRIRHDSYPSKSCRDLRRLTGATAAAGPVTADAPAAASIVLCVISMKWKALIISSALWWHSKTNSIIALIF